MTEAGTPPENFPSPFSPQDRRDLSRRLTQSPEGWSGLSDFDRARWHAYVRVFRKHAGLGSTNPVDPAGQWVDADYDAQAERVWQEENGKRPRNEMLVREGFENLSVREWTLAELDVRFRQRQDEAEAAGYTRDLAGVTKLIQANIKAARGLDVRRRAVVDGYARAVDESPLPPRANDREREYEEARQRPIDPSRFDELNAALDRQGVPRPPQL